MVILFIPGVCGQAFESARISRNFYCFCWSGKKKIVEILGKKMKECLREQWFILLILKNNNPDYKMWNSVPKKKSVY
jgi:hypothetical protein